MMRGRPMIGTPEEAAERRRQQTAERVRRLRERRRAAGTSTMAPAPAAPTVRPANGMAGERLIHFVERIERLEQELAGLRTRNPALKDAYAAERRAAQEDLRRVWAEVESAGFAVEALREVIRLRAIPPARRAELEATVSAYRQVLGM